MHPAQRVVLLHPAQRVVLFSIHQGLHVFAVCSKENRGSLILEYTIKDMTVYVIRGSVTARG